MSYLLLFAFLARGKAPGLDGLPLEFYLSFWHLLAPDSLSVLNFSFRDGHFPISLRTGVITLLFKKGDCCNPANWRPITLLNVDYKICSLTLVARLLKVIHHVVGPDQTLLGKTWRCCEISPIIVKLQTFPPLFSS